MARDSARGRRVASKRRGPWRRAGVRARRDGAAAAAPDRRRSRRSSTSLLVRSEPLSSSCTRTRGRSRRRCSGRASACCRRGRSSPTYSLREAVVVGVADEDHLVLVRDAARGVVSSARAGRPVRSASAATAVGEDWWSSGRRPSGLRHAAPQRPCGPRVRPCGVRLPCPSAPSRALSPALPCARPGRRGRVGEARLSAARPMQTVSAVPQAAPRSGRRDSCEWRDVRANVRAASGRASLVDHEFPPGTGSCGAARTSSRSNRWCPPSGHLAGQPALARPARHRVRATRPAASKPPTGSGTRVPTISGGGALRVWFSRSTGYLARLGPEKWIRWFRWMQILTAAGRAGS